jgi:ABC-type dipeptide/oligopeptide/nickel transport system ATPase subunit
MKSVEEAPTLVAENLWHAYPSRSPERWSVQDVNFVLTRGRTIAVVGESGAGKSTLTRILAGLERPVRGRVLVDGSPVRTRPGAVSPVQMVFQHPEQALNRFCGIGASVSEPLRHSGRRDRRRRVGELLESVGIPSSRFDDKPSAFSGGQLQRIVIARALAAEPRVLLCDEPTSALDVSVQAQIINLLLALQSQRGFACVLVTHDLGVAKVLADEVLVLKNGSVIEHADSHTFFRCPAAEYSKTLLAAAASHALGSDRHVAPPTTALSEC